LKCLERKREKKRTFSIPSLWIKSIGTEHAKGREREGERKRERESSWTAGAGERPIWKASYHFVEWAKPRVAAVVGSIVSPSPLKERANQLEMREMRERGKKREGKK